MKRLTALVLGLSLLLTYGLSFATPNQFPPRTILVPAGNNRFIPQGVGPFLYDPNHSLYEWELGDHPYEQPCYYDENVGQWVGPCNISLDQPGYSITVPNRVR